MKNFFGFDSDSLIEKDDIPYDIPSQDKLQIHTIWMEIDYTCTRSMIKRHLSRWFKEVEKNYIQAYTLYRNGSAENLRSRDHAYRKHLHRRSVESIRRLCYAYAECSSAASAMEKYVLSENWERIPGNGYGRIALAEIGRFRFTIQKLKLRMKLRNTVNQLKYFFL